MVFEICLVQVYVNLGAKRSNKTEMAGLEIEKSYSNMYNILNDS